MPKLTADFQNIATEFEFLKAGIFNAKVLDITEGETRENKLPQLTYELEVASVVTGDEKSVGKKIKDFITLKTKKGERNDAGYGRVRAYTIAIQGEAAGASGEIDTDAHKGGVCQIVVEEEPYIDDTTKQQKVRAKITKVLPQS